MDSVVAIVPWVLTFMFTLDGPVAKPGVASSSRRHQWVGSDCTIITALLGQPRGNCSMNCLRIRPGGRWGNEIIQIMRASQFAEVSGFRTVFFWRGMGLFQRPFMFGDIQFQVDDERESCFEDRYFTMPKDAPDFPFLNVTLPGNFKQSFGQLFRVAQLPDDTLVMHVRSGDIFRGHYNKNMAQPPCRFYGDVMQRRVWSHVLVAAEDVTGNPCTEWALARGAVHRVSTLREDLKVLLGAKYLAIGRGTMGLAVAFLSYNVKTLYTFNFSHFGLDVAVHDNCIPDDVFFLQVVRCWRPSEWQLGQMRTGQCRQWEKVPFGKKRENAWWLQDFLI